MSFKKYINDIKLLAVLKVFKNECTQIIEKATEQSKSDLNEFKKTIEQKVKLLRESSIKIDGYMNKIQSLEQLIKSASEEKNGLIEKNIELVKENEVLERSIVLDSGKLADLTAKLKYYEEVIVSGEKDYDKLLNQFTDLEMKCEDLEAKIAFCGRKEKSLDVLLKQKEATNEFNRMQIESLKKDIKKLTIRSDRAKMTEMNKKIVSLQSELDNRDNIIKNLESIIELNGGKFVEYE